MESEIDANFYRLIHQLSAATADGSDRRTQDRKPFSLWQRIAPSDGRCCPDQSQFFEVQCYDLTQNGFSFLVARRPSFDRLVVEFGVPPDLIYVAAQILHYSRVLIHPDGRVERVRRHVDDESHDHHDDPADASRPTPKILVGCRFTRRVPRPVWADLIGR